MSNRVGVSKQNNEDSDRQAQREQLPKSDRADREMVRGAGVTAVLSLLAEGEGYGYQLAEDLAQRTNGVLDLGQATLYPLLYNLEAKGLVAARRQRLDNGRQRKYYRLTPAGAKALHQSQAKWRRLVEALTSLRVFDQETSS